MLTRARSSRSSFGRTFAALVAGLALAATVGCGAGPETTIEQADDQPDKSEQQYEDDEPTPSPTPTGPEHEPYVQVALEYYDAVNNAIATGDAQRLRDLSTKSCEACRDTADTIEEIYESGGSIEGGQLEPDLSVDLEPVVDKNRGVATIEIVYDYESQILVEESGAEPEKFPKKREKDTLTLEREGEKWLITKITTEDYEG